MWIMFKNLRWLDHVTSSPTSSSINLSAWKRTRFYNSRHLDLAQCVDTGPPLPRSAKLVPHANASEAIYRSMLGVDRGGDESAGVRSTLLWVSPLGLETTVLLRYVSPAALSQSLITVARSKRSEATKRVVIRPGRQQKEARLLGISSP